MALKAWRTFEAECLHCGGEANVFTDSGKDNYAFDGDQAICEECGCPGHVVIDESNGDGEATGSISWHDEAVCDCFWCRSHRD